MRFVILFIFALIMLFLLVLIGRMEEANAFTDAEAVHAVLGEARGEGLNGMIAVSETIRNRGTLKGVYGSNSNFEASTKVWLLGWEAWRKSKTTRIVDGATHWQSESDLQKTHWLTNPKMIFIKRIGNHYFFREKLK